MAKASDIVGTTGAALWWASFIPTVALPLRKAYLWLRYGDAGIDPRLSDLFAHPHFSWVGVQWVADWLWQHSLAITSPICGAVAFGCLLLIANDMRDRETAP